GQLGDNTTTSRATPARVGALSGTFTQVSAGGSHSLALRSDGSVWAWGANASRQLGDGTTTERHLPVRVAEGLPGGIQRIDAGAFGSAASDSAQAIWAWGQASNQARGSANMQLSGAYGFQFSVGSATALAIGGELGPPPPPTATVPNLVGLSQQAATDALTAIGLHVSTVVNVIDPQHAGTVSATDPPAGTVLFQTDDGGGVQLKIGTQAPPVSVPVLNGLSLAAATQALQSAGLGVGLQFQVGDALHAGTIVNQNPAAGTSVAAASNVDITLATWQAG